MSIKDNIQEPYYVAENPPFTDFNREIVQPGENDVFPSGALGIRCDDDFWAVAALPLKYRDVPLPDLVRELWPDLADEATYGPDSGSHEQEVYFLKMELSGARIAQNCYRKRMEQAEAALKSTESER